MAAPNFYTQDDFPLFATEIFDGQEYEDEETGESCYTDFDQWLFERCKQRVEEFNAGLEFYQIELRGGYYAGVQTFLTEKHPEAGTLTKYYTAEEWRGNRADARKYPGSYYSYEFAYAYKEQQARENRERREIAAFCRTFLRDHYDFHEYGVSSRFSNGETWYKQVA